MVPAQNRLGPGKTFATELVGVGGGFPPILNRRGRSTGPTGFSGYPKEVVRPWTRKYSPGRQAQQCRACSSKNGATYIMDV